MPDAAAIEAVPKKFLRETWGELTDTPWCQPLCHFVNVVIHVFRPKASRRFLPFASAFGIQQILSPHLLCDSACGRPTPARNEHRCGSRQAESPELTQFPHRCFGHAS